VTAENIRRRRAVILSADVKDDGRLLWGDEDETLKVLTAHNDVTTTLIQQHHGRLLDSPGDNILAVFTSAVDAVQGAVAIQKRLKARNAQLPENHKIEFHIGINLGDVIADSDRLYGDSVNIAVRLESLAEPGGICISKTVYDQIEDKLPFGYEYLGEKTVKNASKPVAAYRILVEPEGAIYKEEPLVKSEQLDELKQIEDIFVQARMRRRNRSKTRSNRRLRNYLIFNAILFLINLMTYHGYWWFIWPALGWGVFILMGWKRTAYSASDKKAGFETETLLPIPHTHTSGTKATFFRIRVEQTDGEGKKEETVNIKVPLKALKAGVKLNSFLPRHAREKVNEVLMEKGLNFDPASLEGGRLEVFLDSLTDLDIVVAKDGEKVSISCE
jgi:class 3 adenylate cyclase